MESQKAEQVTLIRTSFMAGGWASAPRWNFLIISSGNHFNLNAPIEFFCWAGLPIVVLARLSVWGEAMRERLHLGFTGNHCLCVSKSM